MEHLLKFFYSEFLKTLKSPKRILGILDNRLPAYLSRLYNRLRVYFYDLKVESRFLGRNSGASWVTHGTDQAFKKRIYNTYENYILHQRAKLGRIAPSDMETYDRKYRKILLERLEKLNLFKEGMAVLCLAARVGTEVKAFLDIGCFAVGIDLNPGENNKYVLYGDFHDIQFPAGSMDVVFTNSLDHCLDVERLISEIKRVLKPKGFLIIEAMGGSSEGQAPALYESFWWSKIDDIVSLFENSQFKLAKRSSCHYPWYGEQLLFTREE